MAKILLVEDSELSREVLSRRLERRGHQLSKAANAGEGLALAARESPELILLDLGLPDLDGFETVWRLKSDAITRAIPVVALTANSEADVEARTLAAGFDAYQEKLGDFEGLIRTIDRVIAARQVRGEEA